MFTLFKDDEEGEFVPTFATCSRMKTKLSVKKANELVEKFKLVKRELLPRRCVLVMGIRRQQACEKPDYTRLFHTLAADIPVCAFYDEFCDEFVYRHSDGSMYVFYVEPDGSMFCDEFGKSHGAFTSFEDAAFFYPGDVTCL